MLQIASYLPFTTILLLFLLFMHCRDIRKKFLSWLEAFGKCEQKTLILTDDIIDTHYIKRQNIHVVYLIALIFTQVAIIIALFIIQIISLMKYTEYGNNALHYDDRSLLTGIIAITAVFFTVFIIMFTSCLCYYKLNFEIMPILVDITFTTIILGSLHYHYMLLAFIHNPLQTSVTYLFVTACVLCLYFLFLPLSSCCHIYYEKQVCKALPSFTCITTIVATGTFLLMAILSIHIFTFGGYSIDNYLEVEHLLLPLFLGVLSYIFYKPAVKYIKQIIYVNNKQNTNNRNGYIDLEGGNFSNESAELQSSTVNND